MPYITPQNERSFSGLVDDAILVTGKPAQLTSIVGYALSTIRECQGLGTFYQDQTEVEITATANPHVWSRPANLRSVAAVRYMTSGVWPKFIPAGPRQRDRISYYYAVDDSYVFCGVTVGETIAAQLLKWVAPKMYYGRLGDSTAQYVGGPYSVRPAYFDTETGTWKYLNTAGDAYVSSLASTALEEAARGKVWHWMLENYYDLVLEGVKTKVFAAGGDVRNAPSYALYKSLQNSFKYAVGAGAEGQVGG